MLDIRVGTSRIKLLSDLLRTDVTTPTACAGPARRIRIGEQKCGRGGARDAVAFGGERTTGRGCDVGCDDFFGGGSGRAAGRRRNREGRGQRPSPPPRPSLPVATAKGAIRRARTRGHRPKFVRTCGRRKPPSTAACRPHMARLRPTGAI